MPSTGIKLGALLLIATIVATVPAHAQAVGSLVVRVLGSEGDPLPGAVVKLSNTQALVGEEAWTSDRDGVVRFPVLRVGDGYVVEVTAPGFTGRRESGLTIVSGGENELVFRMTEEQVERVRVSATTPLVDLDDSSSTTRFTDDFVSDLPVIGRFYQSLLTLAPGVTDPNRDGNPIVHGSRSRDFQANLSGVSNVDPFSGQTAALVNPNSIQELEVITGGASVQFGRAQGGFANIVQKQGTNEFEGVAELLYQNALLDVTGIANDLGPFVLNPHTTSDPDFETLQPSLSLSGPIVRDRAWFRLNHDLIDRESPVNTGDGLVITPETRWLHSDQITWQVSPRNKLQFQYSADDSDNGNVGVSALIAPASAFRFEREVETVQMNWTAAYSTRMLIESVAALTTIDNKVGPTALGTNNCVPFDDFFGNSRCTNTETGEISGPTPLNRDARSERFTLRSQATIYGGEFAGGSHQFKVGLNVENERYFQNDVLRPDLTFFEIEERIFFTTIFIRTIDVTFSVPGESALASKGNGYGFYFEDQYKPFDNVTFTLGARVDRDEATANGQLPFDPVSELADYTADLDACLEAGFAPFAVCSQRARNLHFTALPDVLDFLTGIELVTGIENAAQSLGGDVFQQTFFAQVRRQDTIDIDNTNFSPLLSVKWDPFKNGRTAFSASYRRYYDKIFLNVPLIESQPPTTDVTFEIFPTFGAVFDEDGDTEGPFAIPSDRDPENGVKVAPSIKSVDRKLKTPYQDEFILTFEREIATETALRLEYVNRKYRDQFQDVDINREPGDFGRCRKADGINTATIVPSNGPTYIDEFTQEEVIDNTPGPGDGIIDDCAGMIDIELSGFEGARIERPDGIPDLYIQNPAFGAILFLSNSNAADYEAFVIALTRRQYRAWEFQGSYTWSRAEGNGEDFQQEFGNDQSLTDDEFGFQSTDQRHFVRLLGTWISPIGVRLGTAIRWQSGLPYSILEDQQSFAQTPLSLGGFGGNISQVRTIFPSGVRNDQRNPSYWLVDFKLTKDLNVGRGVNVQLSAEIFNVFNRDYFRVYNDTLQLGRRLNGIDEATRDFGRRWQIGLRVSF